VKDGVEIKIKISHGGEMFLPFPVKRTQETSVHFSADPKRININFISNIILEIID